MKTMKLTALFAVMSMACGVAMAQPADTTGTMDQRPRPRAEGRMGGGPADSPVAKLRLANTLESATADQKAKIAEFMEARKPQFDALRTEMQQAMQAAREQTDRQARREAMKPLREKHEALRTEVDTFLKGVLNAEQITELETKAKTMMDRGRMGRRGDDASTTGIKARKTDGKKPGKKGERKGRDGKRWNREKSNDAAAPATDASTTGTAANNPFATTE